MSGLAERLWSRVDRSAGPDGCWPWTGARLPHGYGRMGVGSRREQTRRTELTHRIAYAVHTGEDVSGLVVRHRCDNPPCCNPAHLQLGTMADNTQDMISRGRARGGVTGPANGASKLTEADVRTIRLRSAAENHEAISRDYGVSRTAIRHVVERKTWRHVA